MAETLRKVKEKSGRNKTIDFPIENADEYLKKTVKISDVEVQQESVEILCEVETPKWEDVELFRFFRATGAVGELFVRDFHAKLKDKKVDRGFCVTPGAFSEEAHKYVEGRPIDLIEKAQLMQLLKKITLK